MPFVVRDNATGDIVGCTRYFNVDAANRRLEIGHTWYAKRVQRTALNTECKLLLLDARVRDAALHRRRVPHALVQPRVARGDRAARRQAGRRAAQPPADGRTARKRDTVVFSIIDSEWPAVKRHLQFQLERAERRAMLTGFFLHLKAQQAAGVHARAPDAARGAGEARRLAVDRRFLHAVARLLRQGRAALRPLRPRVRRRTSRASTRSSTSAPRFPRSGCARSSSATCPTRTRSWSRRWAAGTS